jgi:mycothiol synthase
VSRVETRAPQSDREVAGVEALLDRADATRGEPALDRDRFARVHRSAGVAAWEPGADAPVAYAQVERTERRWEVELVVEPERRGDADQVGAPALDAVVERVRSAGGGQAYLWVSRPTDADDRMARAAGFEPDRDLWQMVRPLPTGLPYDLDTRPFVVGKDEAPWVEVNNRAFAWHPEQGGWTVADVLAREAEPWFDAEGFLLHERGGRLAGFCWTKVHDRHDPPLGEIYVIAVDPDFAGLGLGRALTLAGLDHLARDGLTVGMLYVDAGNTPAVRLYESLGFTVDHIDRAYAFDVGPA